MEFGVGLNRTLEDAVVEYINWDYFYERLGDYIERSVPEGMSIGQFLRENRAEIMKGFRTAFMKKIPNEFIGVVEETLDGYIRDYESD